MYKKNESPNGFGFRTLWKSQRVLCWKPRRAKLSSEIKEVQVGMLLNAFFVSRGCLAIARFFAFYNTANMFGGWTIEQSNRFMFSRSAPKRGLFGRWLSYRLQQRHPAAYVGEILSVNRKWSELWICFLFGNFNQIQCSIVWIHCLDSWPSDEVDVASR